MSWSINKIGTKSEVLEALQQQSETLTGQSKEEFDAALPHIIGIVNQNIHDDVEPQIEISANGHGYIPTTGSEQRNCSVNIRRV